MYCSQIFFRGSADSTRQAHQLIMELIKDPDKDIADIVGKLKKSHSHSSSSSNSSSSSHHASTNNNASSSNHPPSKSNNSTTSKGSGAAVSSTKGSASSRSTNQGLLKAVAPQSVPLSATYAPSLAQAVFPNAIQQFRPTGIPLTNFTPNFPPTAAATVPTTGWGKFQVRAVHPDTATAAAQKRHSAAAAAAAAAASRQGANTSTSNATSTVTTSSISAPSAQVISNAKSPRSAGAVRQLFTQGKQQSTSGNSVSAPVGNSKAPSMTPSSNTGNMNPPTFASKIVENKVANQKQPNPQVQMPLVSATVVSSSQQSTHSPVQSMNSAGQQLPSQTAPTSATSQNATGFSLFNPSSSTHSMGFWGTAVQQRNQQQMPRMETNGEVNLSQPEMAKAPGYKRSSIGSSIQAQAQPSVNAAFLNTGYGPPGSNFTTQQPYNFNINTGVPDQPEYPSPIGSLNTNAPQYNPIPNPASHTQPPTPPTTVMSTSSSPISPGTSPRSGTTTPSPVALTSEPPPAIGQDRRLPRPIGNERTSRGQQRKTPVGFPSIGSDMVMGSVANSIWAYNPGRLTNSLLLLCRARENMQLEKVKKEIINSRREILCKITQFM